MKIHFLSLWIVVFSLVIGCATTRPVVRPEPKIETKKVDINAMILQLSQQISSTMLEQNKRKAAVMNFPLLTGEMTELGLYISDKLTDSLFQYRDKFEVVERARLESALKEMELGATGIIDDKTAQSIGKVIGADAIVIGTITDLGKEIDINVRMLGTERAIVLAVASSFLDKDETIIRLGKNVKAAQLTMTKKTEQKADPAESSKPKTTLSEKQEETKPGAGPDKGTPASQANGGPDIALQTIQQGGTSVG